MIRTLVIDNIALINHIELEFQRGLTVLSGETGSGKSIIIDSLAFVLGDRADKTLIKYGEETASVSAIFEIEENSSVAAKLKEYGYEAEGELMISRKMSLSGKNEIRVQGMPVTLSVLKDISASLVDIFGQSQHLNLLKEDSQLAILDAFCVFGNCDALLKEELYPALKNTEKQLRAFGGNEAERERLRDILRFQIDEISSAELSEEEESELEQAHRRIVNIEKIASALSEASACLGGDGGAVAALAQAAVCLNAVSSVEPDVSDLAERLKAARIEADDVCETLDRMLADTDYSPAEMDKLEARLEKIRTLKRKYGGTVAETLKFLKEAEEKYENLVNSTEIIERLNGEKQRILVEMFYAANEKSEIRRKTAAFLADRIKKELSDLGMGGASFEISFNSPPDFETYRAAAAKDGYDRIEFLMSANVGEPLKPLAKVISGGEMSRFMLAVKNITALAEKIPTMVFDEIDTGISGGMARMVAMKLANVSRDNTLGRYQCIVITHLPQIVAMADVNMLIEKSQKQGRTVTDVSVLCSEQEKYAEIARLMGGVGEHALVNAAELVKWSDDYKSEVGESD